MKNKGISRKEFLARAAAGFGFLAISGTACFSNSDHKSEIKVRMLGQNHKLGHQLRQKQALKPSKTLQKKLLIIGGGIAGLACAWKLQKLGFEDFVLLELENELGGNSRAGKMTGIEHPWGAHYLPLPEVNNRQLLEFLEEAGVLVGFDALGKPIYDEAHLCHSPQERLQIHGKWQNGLVPELGVPQNERNQIKAFSEAIQHYKNLIGSDGKPAFCIPSANSSNDPNITKLDQINMEAWLLENAWDSPHLHWYINYCCRDDFGMEAKDCSAWAGIHYFASRKGIASNAENNALLTWPEGNAWLARKLHANFKQSQVMCNTMVAKLQTDENGVSAIAVQNTNGSQTIEFNAKAAVFAGPQFVAARLLPDRKSIADNLSYAPWIVANIQVRTKGHDLLEDLHWDNVCYGRDTLGYVHAAHQMLNQQIPNPTVLTWYAPLSKMEPNQGRKMALENGINYWRDFILKDMEFAHPGITQFIEAIDIWPWGHAMIRPVPGLISGDLLQNAQKPEGNIYFAHSDLSGISIFEEAFFRGITAAETVFDEFQSV